MNISETNKGVKSLNNYSPALTPTHTSGGEGFFKLTLHLREITHGCEIVQWDNLIPKSLMVSENKPVWIK